MKILVVIGSGAHGRIVAEAAAASGSFAVLGFADENTQRHGLHLDDLKVLGHWRDLCADVFIVAIGNNASRSRVASDLSASGRKLATVIHPRAIVSPRAEIGEGAVILAGAVVQAGARLGKNVIVNAGAVIDHDAVIGNHGHAGPNSALESFAQLQDGEFLAAGAVRKSDKS